MENWPLASGIGPEHTKGKKMAQFFAPFQLHYGRDAAGGSEGPGGPRLCSFMRRITAAELAAIAANQAGPGLILQIFGLPVWATIRHWQIFAGIAPNGNSLWFEGKRDVPVFVSTDGIATGATLATNVVSTTPGQPGSLLALPDAIRTALLAADVDIYVWVSASVNPGAIFGGPQGVEGNQGLTSYALLGEYIDDLTGDSIADPRRTVQRIFNGLKNAGDGRTLLARSNQTGQTLYARGCGRAYNNPCGAVLLTNADIGVQFGQVPPERALWTPDQLRAHPSVFVRQGAAVRGVTPANTITQSGQNDFIGLSPITDPAGIVTLYSVNERPTHSTWDVIVDGHRFYMTVSHGTADLRRPRDIWNALFVPRLVRQQQPGGEVTPLDDTLYEMQQSFETDTPGPAAANPRGGLQQRLQYLDYASLVGLWSTETGNPVIGVVEA